MGNCASVFVARNTTLDRVEAKMFLFAKMAFQRKSTKRIDRGENSIKVQQKKGKFTIDIETIVQTFYFLLTPFGDFPQEDEI